MKIIFFSDAHGNGYSVIKFFEDIKYISYDKLIFGGDIFGYYYDQEKIIKLLREHNCICLLGNHDRMFLDILERKIEEDNLIMRYGLTYRNISERISKESVEFLYSLNSRVDLETDGIHLTFVHGSVDNPLNGRIYIDTEITDYRKYEGLDYVFMGHTHHKMKKILANGTILINPGSIGQQRDGKGCSYVVFDTVTRTNIFCPVDFDRKYLAADIEAYGESDEMKEKLLEVLYRKQDYREL